MINGVAVPFADAWVLLLFMFIGVLLLLVLIACLSLCERLAGLWLRPCYVRSLPAHDPLCALPRRVVAGNLDAFAILISCLALARASWCPLVLLAALQPHQHANYRPRHRGHKAIPLVLPFCSA